MLFFKKLSLKLLGPTQMGGELRFGEGIERFENCI